MKANIGLHDLPHADAESVRQDLEEKGWLVFVLPGGMSDGREFIRGVKSRIPLNPPLVKDDNWNALNDSLFSGIDDLDADKVALIWPDSKTLAELAPEAYRNAREIFEENASLLADTTKLMVVLT